MRGEKNIESGVVLYRLFLIVIFIKNSAFFEDDPSDCEAAGVRRKPAWLERSLE